MPSAEATPGPTLPGQIMPVAGYDPFWLILGVLLVALAALIVGVALLLTRGPRARTPRPRPRPSLGELRERATHEIDDVERQLRSRAITPRRAHARLSRIVREFVAAASERPADHMTLTELREMARTQGGRFAPVAGAVAVYYPQVFAPDAPDAVDIGLRLARSTVAGWR